jgi:uncharacterized protein (TIGR03083 family)
VRSTAREDTVDTGALYEAVRQRFLELLRRLADEQLERVVPATPDWRVRDALAHVVGITADLNALNFGRGDPDAWTAAQVATRRGAGLEAMAAEWDRESPQFEDGVRLLGYEIGSHYVGDLHAHVQDVHQALGVPADRDELTVLVSLDFYLHSFDGTLAEAAIGSVEVHAGDEQHVVGVGDVIAGFRGDPFDVLRALSGRRSAGQIRSFAWTGDVDRVVPLLSRYPLPLRDILD